MGVGVSDPVVDAAMPRLFATDQNHNVNAIQQGEQGMNLDDVGSLLKEKAITNLVSIAPASAVADAVRTMNQHKIGAVVVLDQQKLVGIFTERDVLVRVVGDARDPMTTLVSEVMTAEVRSVGSTTPVGDALKLMSDGRYRHLPVQDNGHVLGLISMGDATRWVIRCQQEEFDAAIGAVKRMGYSNRRG